MKPRNFSGNINFFKKIFIKICRLLGYEIIDQSKYRIPTLNKDLNETLSEPGKRSITIPLGQIKITRKIKSLKIIFRSCTSELIMDQNKKRLFDKSKNEYTFRSLNSLLKSTEVAKKIFNHIDFEIIVTDTNSDKKDLNIINSILKKYPFKNKLVEIDQNSFKNKILGNYSKAKFANMTNLYSSLNIATEENNDLLYFVEDDYLHSKNCVLEMLFSYEKFASMFKQEIFLIPADYPYLYTNITNTKIFLGHKKHWRLINESLVTFMTSKDVIVKNINNLMKMATEWKDPWEKPLHQIYEKTPCLSPIPSMSIHCANINSAYGLPPNLDWKKIWDDNENY